MEIEMSNRRFVLSKDLFSVIMELINEQHQASFTVTGMSMWPFICHGRDKVIVEKIHPEKLEKGDIILLQTPLGNYLLHRITRIKGDCFETTGDGNCFRDGWFPRRCVRARVVKIIRKEKEMDCDAFGWKMIFGIWGICFPIRRYLLAALRGISRMKNCFR